MVPGCLEFQTPGYSMIFFWRMDMDGFLYTFDGWRWSIDLSIRLERMKLNRNTITVRDKIRV